MKKVFLLFGIAAFSSASAQQKQVFDINKHLQDLLDKKNTSQLIVKPSGSNKYFVAGSSQPGFKLSAILPDGDKVYLLPPDNMPCIVPDMKQFTAMPDISNPNEYFETLPFRNHLPGAIPNAVEPYRLIVSE